MFRNVLLVGLGSMVGGMARYLLSSTLAERYVSVFPAGTFTVNILGCLAVGCFYGLCERYSALTPELRLFLTVGLCGGFTTFSSFAYENVWLLENRNYLLFGLNSTLSVVLGIAGVVLGLFLTRP